MSINHLFPRLRALAIGGLIAALGLTSLSASAADNGFKDNRHVLIIGVDGVRRDALQQLIKSKDLLTIEEITKRGTTYWNMEAGGDLNGVTKQPTWSLTSWTTVLTGVFLNKHCIEINESNKYDYAHYPHFFKYLREANPKAKLVSICSWAPINDKVLKPSDTGADTEIYNAKGNGGELDNDVRNETVRVLTEEDPDVVFIHLDDVDHAGHSYGFTGDSPEYVSALQGIDDYITNILTALTKRPNYAKENWLVIITTDHGGDGQGHGGQTENERKIFAIFWGKGWDAGKSDNTPLLNDVFAPTILNYLGVKINPAWGMESKPLK